MSAKSRHEIVARLQTRYLKASRSEKTQILDEFVEITGLHRKSAIRAIRHTDGSTGSERRGRQRKYTGDTIGNLVRIWRIAGEICGKRLKPILPELVDTLERHNELQLNDETREQLKTISAATIDRHLKPFKVQKTKGLGTTKPGGLLKNQIRVRTFTEWDNTEAGFVEIDLVAHCGTSVEGQFLYTLTATDVATGWTECMPLLQRNQIQVTQALDLLQQRLPFPLQGVDSDNDSVFINELMLKYCEKHQLTFTRCRPYKKNDQCFVEQKNWSIVRQTIGYQRYSGEDAFAALGFIHQTLHQYTNFYQPTFKLVSKKRDGAKLYKKYDEPMTPLQRVLQLTSLTSGQKAKLRLEHYNANPAQLRRDLDQQLAQLWALRE